MDLAKPDLSRGDFLKIPQVDAIKCDVDSTYLSGRADAGNPSRSAKSLYSSREGAPRNDSALDVERLVNAHAVVAVNPGQIE
jgi:hypothetical protein